MTRGPSLAERAAAILRLADPIEKTRATRALAAAWRAERDAGGGFVGTATPPDHPARPVNPALLDPREMPKRRTGSPAGRAAMLHAIAHIELNAVDLHLDVIARFGHIELPPGFADDWMQAADDEAKHFTLLEDCLRAVGSHYGALPAHAGMWRAAIDTAHDLLGRLAIVPMVLEARGLDVTPGMIALFEKAGDSQAVAALKVIEAEEVAHVAYGSKWFNFLCGRGNIDPKPQFHALVRRYMHSPLKPPFNEARRADAGLPPDFYWPLADSQ